MGQPRAIPPAATQPSATHQPDQLERRLLWRYLRALGADGNEADDLTQEALLVASQVAQERDPDDQHRRAAFLRGIARNLWLRSRRWWRRQREREIAVAVDELWDATVGQDDGGELLARLRECLDGLQPRVRKALELHYHDGLGWRAVAADLAMKQNGVKTLVQRARQTLRQCLERSER